MMALHSTFWSVTLKIGTLTKLGLFFPVVCFIHTVTKIKAKVYRRFPGSFRLFQSKAWCETFCRKTNFHIKGFAPLGLALKLRQSRLLAWSNRCSSVLDSGVQVYLIIFTMCRYLGDLLQYPNYLDALFVRSVIILKAQISSKVYGRRAFHNC